jgi:hypothetical protein
MAITTVSWSTAWRLAVVLSAIVAVLGAALYHFLGVQRPVLVVFAAIVALTVGMRLPAVERTDRVGV